MKNKKKLPIKLIVLCVIIAALVIAGVDAMMTASRSNRAAYVQSVAELDNSWVLTQSNQTGTISDAATQNIYLTSTKVSSVNVEVGQTVEVGDVLFTYDTEALRDEMDVANLMLAAQQDQLTIAQMQYDKAASKPVWTEYEAWVREQYMTKAAEDQADVAMQIAEVEEQIEATSDESKKASLEEQLQDLNTILLIYQYNTEQLEKDTQQHSYADVHEENVKAAQLNVQQVETSVKETQNNINEIRTKINESTVKATMAGIVSFLSDDMTISSTNPFITITSANGLVVISYVNEYKYDHTHVGDTITVNSYMTGATATATITSLSPYPEAEYSENYYGQQASYYQFQATMENADGFNPGDYVSIYTSNAEDTIVIDKIYVRSDSEGSYVLKDDGGKLVRCPVTAAQTRESNYLQITDGLTMDDLIAYPYGKSAFVGNVTTTEEAVDLFSSLTGY